MNQFKQKGFGLIEILVVITVGMGVFLGIEQYLNLSLRSVDRDTSQTEALYLVKSLLEEARGVRDENWSNISGLTPGSQYHFTTSGANPEKRITQAGTGNEGGYTVWFTASQVYRNSVSDDIVASGGAVDSNTLKIIANVSWTVNGALRQINLAEYLTNFR